MNNKTGDSYDLTISVQLTDNFTPAVRTAISYFGVIIVPFTVHEPIAPSGFRLNLSDDRLLINSTFFQSERTFFDQQALRDDEQYLFHVSVVECNSTSP